MVSDVNAGNALPEANLPESVRVKSGATMNVPLIVIDDDGDIPAVLLVAKPAGMELVRWSSQKLLITWQPGVSDIGHHRVVILLEDARDRAVTVRRELQVEVKAAASPDG